MTDLEATVAAAVDRSRARGAECEVWVEERLGRERRVSGGGEHDAADQTTSTAVVTTWREGREGCVVAMGPDAIEHAVDAALSVAAVLPPRLRPARSGLRSLRPDAGTDPERGDTGLPVRWLADMSGTSPLVRDVTLDDLQVLTAFGDSDGSFLQRRVRRSVVQLRCATRDGAGALSRSFLGVDPAQAAAAADSQFESLVRQTTTLARAPETGALPERVVLHGTVMARLLALLAPAVGLDAVREGRSPLAGRVGERIAEPGLGLFDDAPGQGYPFDDEGTVTRRVDVVVDGRLSNFLSDVRTAAAAGVVSTGAGWRSTGGSEVRVRPAALQMEWQCSGATPAAVGPALHVLQATGMHISNDVTGEFSFGAVGLVDDGSGRLGAAGNLTVAGNVVEMLAHLLPAPGPIRYVPRSVGVFASPDVEVRGLTVGR